VVPQTLEARVARLEQQVSLLMGERTKQSQPAADDWKRTVGAFRGDPIVAEMIEESRRIREEDRREARETGEGRPA
jgi:phage-related minor tail protein